MKKRLMRAMLALSAVLMLTVPALAAEPSATPPAIPTEGDVWDGTTQELTSADLVNVDGTYYYEIKSCEQLAFVAETGGAWLGYNYILANNLILNDVVLTWDDEGNCTNTENLLEWKPISSFSGIFRGDNYAISGLYINGTSSGQGLFGKVTGQLYDLAITNCYVKGNHYVGSITGELSVRNSIAENCYSSGAVVGNEYIGGICGLLSGSSVINCTNYTQVFGATKNVGGIIGVVTFSYDSGISSCVNYGTISGKTSLGGIVGNTWSSTRTDVTSCTNYGTIVAHGNSAGGIVGCGSASYCKNYGSVSGYDYVGGICGEVQSIVNCINYGQVSGNSYVGGIGAYAPRPSSGVSVWRCANHGNITGCEYVGGIYGCLNNVTNCGNCYNTGTVCGTNYVGGISGSILNGKTSNHYSTGNISGTTNVGALFGASDYIWERTSLSNCYYLKSSEINSNLYGSSTLAADTKDVMEAVSSEELQRRITFDNWDFDEVWSISPDKNGGYPYLKWQEETISDVSLTGISLSKSKVIIAVGDVLYLTHSHSPATATAPEYSWSTSDKSVLKVSQNGRIEAVGAGSAVVTLSGGGHTATCTVTVEYRTPTDYRLNSITLRTDEGEQLDAIPEDGFWASVSLTKLAETGNVTVLLAAYDEDGRFVQMFCSAAEGLTQNQSVTFSFYLSNASGNIASLKAFTVSSLSNLTPLCAAIEI